LRRKQQSQERARALARELVSGILDIQIRQFEENGLAALPIFKEVRDMRGNLDGLVEKEMQGIVQLLVRAQDAGKDEQLAIVHQARGEIREVVVRLMAERQKLLRRLQIARIAAQVRQLIVMETKTLSVTQALPTMADSDRDPAHKTTIQDQLDVKSLFLVLLDSLVDVSNWGGQVGAGASDGLRILKAAQVGQELDNADAALAAPRFDEATKSQKAVIKGLRALLEKIEETQGLISSDREQALKLVRELLEKQEQLREEVRRTEKFEEQAVEKMVETQSEIHKAMGNLSDALDEFPATEPLLEQAKAAAYEAAAQLFEEHKPETLAEQTKVIGSLAEIEEQLKHAINLEQADKSAEQLAQESQRLEQLAQQLEEITVEQEKVVENAAPNAAQAQQEERRVAAALAEATQAATADDQDLPGVVESRLADAQEQVAAAIEVLADASPTAQQARQEAAASAEQAIQRALAETQAQLADTQRRQMAVEIGELARAAEALERAAASEREIATASAEAAQEEGLSQEQAAVFAAEQADVQRTAAKIAEGLQAIEPQVAQQLQQAAQPIQQAAQGIEAAKQQTGEPAKQTAAQVAQAADQAARMLEQAAKDLRSAVGKTAEDLVALADQQLADVAGVQAPVEQAIAARPPDAGQMLEQLQQAVGKVQQAQVEQQRAAGREQAAAAVELAHEIDDAMAQQAEVNAAVEALARGRASSPLAAATQQQRVAERAGELAQQAAEASPQTAEALQQAATAAAEAAKETLGGNPNRAQEARQAASEALNRAQQAAEQAAAEAAQAPPGDPAAMPKPTSARWPTKHNSWPRRRRRRPPCPWNKRAGTRSRRNKPSQPAAPKPPRKPSRQRPTRWPLRNNSWSKPSRHWASSRRSNWPKAPNRRASCQSKPLRSARTQPPRCRLPSKRARRVRSRPRNNPPRRLLPRTRSNARWNAPPPA